MTRWGIKGADWLDIRHLPLGEDAARGWARNLSTSRGTRRHSTTPESITLFRDDGDGWQQVEVYEAKETAQ